MSFTLQLSIPIKPHIAQYLKIKYGQPFVFSKSNPFSVLFKKMLTTEKMEQLQIDTENLSFINVQLSGKKIGSVLSEKNYRTEMVILENYFWSIMKHEVMEDTIFTRNVSESIRKIYNHYEIDEEMYSLDNFQRQINRIGIRSKSTKIYIRKKSFRKINEAEGLQIARDFYIRGITLSQIQQAYNIGKATAFRIKNKYKNKLISQSKSGTYLERRIHKIDSFNFNRCSSLRSLS